jgi:hypothetical protein
VSAIRLYIDEDAMDHRLVGGLRRRQVDVRSTREEGMTHADDETQLVHATSLGRVLYTRNVGDFCRLHNEFLLHGRDHAGIIVVTRPLPDLIGEQMRRLLRLMGVRSAEDMVNALEFLGNY